MRTCVHTNSRGVLPRLFRKGSDPETHWLARGICVTVTSTALEPLTNAAPPGFCVGAGESKLMVEQQTPCPLSQLPSPAFFV